METSLRTWVRNFARLATVCGMVVVVTLNMGGCPPPPPATECTANADCADDEGGPVCVEGQCVECATAADCGDNDACTADTCNDSNVCVSADLSCDDGDACTADSCDPATGCSNVAADCNDDDACTDDSCDAATGECVHTDVVCDEGEVCVDGVCALTCDDAGDCDDSDPCTDDTCVNNACDNAAKACDDGLHCTGTETCDAATGDCVSDGDPCDAATETCNEDTDACDPAAACETDADCLDDVFCNGDETCVDGACVAGTRPCDDANGAGCDDDTATESCDEGDAAAVCTACPSDTLDFTLNADNLTGTTGNDTFSAPLLFNSGNGSQIASLQIGDSGNGLAGADILNATLNGGTVVPTSLAGIETQNYTAFSATTLTATGISGVDTINSTSSVATLTVSSLQELVDFGMSSINDAAVGLSLSFATSTITSGTADTITGTFSAANAGTVTITTAAANGFETLGLVSSGATANTIANITQTTGTSMVTANISGAQTLQLKVMPTSIRTYNASTATGAVTLGSGTRADGTDTYATFAAVDISAITGGTGDDVFILGTSLDSSDSDQSGESINGGTGTDVLQATLASTLSSALPISNVEELRVNATSAASFSLLNVSGVATVTVESDDSATTLTCDNVPVTSTAQTWPTLAFRGDGTAAAQTYDTVTYNAFGASASTGDKLTATFANRATSLNTTGTSNAHGVSTLTVGSGSSTGIEQLTIAATDGPLTVSSSVSCNTCTSLTVTGSSNVALGTVTAAADTITSVTASGVTGNFSAVIDAMNGGTVLLGSGNDTVDLTGSAAAATTVQGGAGNDTLTGAGGVDSIQGGAGTDTIVGAAGADSLNGGDDADTLQGDAGADTITTGNGADTVVLTTVAASSANADTISDFTAGSGGDQLEMDISALETSGATDADEAVNFVELNDGSAVVDTDTVSIQEIAIAAGATTVTANVNVIAMIGTVASTSALETLLESGGGAPLTIAAAAGDITSCFPVLYSDGTDAYLAICFAETETTNDTDFDTGDLTCVNIAKMSSNAAISASEFVAANLDFVP